jgi:hypothetical protein
MKSKGSDGPVLEDPTPKAEVLAGHQMYAKRNLGMPGAEKIPSHINELSFNQKYDHKEPTPTTRCNRLDHSHLSCCRF